MPSTKTEQTTLYEALMNAQQAFGPVLKNATNPHLKSKYADLGSVIETITGPLNDNGLLFFQTIQPGDALPELVTTIVLAATGDKIESRAPLVSKDPSNPQAFGAALTYMRRYSLLAMCGLAPEDDDGHAATRQPTAPATSARPHTRQHDEDVQPVNSPLLPKAANVRKELSDKEFDEEVRKALTEKNGTRYRELVDEAEQFVGRWMVLIRNCESLGALEWIEKKAQASGVDSAGIPIAIDKRRRELTLDLETRPF